MKKPYLPKFLFLCSVFLLGTFTGYAQTPQTPTDCKTGCTSSDVVIKRAYLVDSASLQQLSGNTPCSGAVKVKLALELTTNTPRVGVVVYANVKNFTGGVFGNILVTKKECFSVALNQPTNKVVFSGAFSWSCGMPIVLTDVFLGWGTGNTDFCQNNPAFRCPGTPSKCYSLPDGKYITIEIPLARSIARSKCPDAVGGNTATFNLTGLNGDVSSNAPNVTVTWFKDSTYRTAIATPAAYNTVSSIVYAKVANNADTSVYSRSTVTLTVLAGPMLSITNPAAVCAPGTADITATAVTAGSSLPTGTSLSYWTNSSATTTLATPSAVGAGTYYIKASTNTDSVCVDVRSVTVTVHAKPALVITNPAAVCSPATVNLTDPAVTSGSTLPTGTSLSYWTNQTATTALSTPSAAGSGTYYIKAATNTTPSCSDIRSVLVTVRASPVLSITNPPAVCSPATVNLTAAAVTANSTLPGGTVLSYWTNAAATTSLATPGAVSGGTYYIKASSDSTSACADIKPVTATVNARPNAPSLCGVQPSMCGPATGTLTVTSPTGAGYQYSIDNGQHWQNSVTFSNIAPASNPSILVRDSSSGCASSTATNCSAAGSCTQTARIVAAPVQEEKKTRSVEILAEDELSVQVFPNPYRNSVNFSFTAPVTGKVVLELFDNTGRQLAAISYGEITAGTSRVLNYVPRQKLNALQLYRLRVGSKVVSGKIIQRE